MKNVKFIEVKSEIGAGTRGASMGIDAIKIAALDYGSNMFKQIESLDIKTENHLLFEPAKTTFIGEPNRSLSVHALQYCDNSRFITSHKRAC